MPLIDLHTHSLYSDGKDSAENLVKRAKSLGLNLFAISDHDDLRSKAHVDSSFMVTGTELTVYHHTDMYHFPELHLLGYNFNSAAPDLMTELQSCREHRESRFMRLVEQVNALRRESNQSAITPTNVDQFKAELSQTGSSTTLGQPHLAALMLRLGMVSTEREAFGLYLSKCNVPKRELKLITASQMIRANGGRVIFPHPGGLEGKASLRRYDLKAQERIIESLWPYIDGIEAYYFDHSPQMIDFYCGVVDNAGKLVTAGNDHHGGEKDRLRGIEFPQARLDRLLQAFSRTL